MSSRPGRRSGALDDPEVKCAGATFRDLREVHTRRIPEVARGIELDS
jgi:hypothetical protein